MRQLIAAVTVMLLAVPLAADPIAHYTFDEAGGDVLHDRSGNGHDGHIVGATWDGDALQFDGKGDYVDFGPDSALKLSGDFTYLAWVKLDPPAFPDYNTNWTIFDCEHYADQGTILRIDGSQAKLMFRSSRAGNPYVRFGQQRLERGGHYLVGVVRRGDVGTLIVDGVSDGEFNIGGDPVYGDVPFKISHPVQSFGGVMYDVKVFDRALTASEIASEYWSHAERFDKDATRRGQLAMRSHVYDESNEALVEVDAFGILPLAGDERLVIALESGDGQVVAAHEVADLPPSCRVERAFDLSDLAPGRYRLAVRIAGADQARGEQVEALIWPAAPDALPSPQQFAAGALPLPQPRQDVQANLAAGGGFRVISAGLTLPIESTFSVPDSPAMQLKVTGRAEGGAVRSAVGGIIAENDFYRVERQLEAQPGRVLVRDRFTNLTDEPVGVIFANRAAVANDTFENPMLCGYQVAVPNKRRIKTNPTAFFNTRGKGVGLVALDDVSIVQGQGIVDEQGVAIGSDEFALGANASYTIEWAVYVRDGGDYYDLINDVRTDEGRNNTTVEGSWAGVPGSQSRRSAEIVPSAEYYERRNAAYINIACLSWATDDRTVSLEGIEFINYPQERAAVRETVDAVMKIAPNAKVMFHVAPNLFATGTPDELWPDSQIIDAQGNQTVYAYNYEGLSYFSKERHEAGWRWWSYYPAMDNSYGQALLDSVDVMMGEMGCSGVFVDGFLWEYGGAYSYDRFDGHTADIDPATGRITRLKTAIPLKQQHAMVAYGRAVMARGGMLVANNSLPTRTVASEPFIFDKEITEGPEMHLLPNPCTLGNPAGIEDERTLYADILGKLQWGNLYFYYGEPHELKYESPAAHMYPITVTEVRENYVKGNERLVTALDGVYGWPGDRALHFVYRYDNRGRRVRHDFVTTADADSLRTQLDLDMDEMAIIERLPVTIQTASPVNVRVVRYDGMRVELLLNGRGEVTLSAGAQQQTIALDGSQTVTIDID